METLRVRLGCVAVPRFAALFVRGMVVRAVEESCRKSGLDRVTVHELDRIRSRMPTPKIFG